MEEEIKVSISCITYNHESYIAQSLEGFLMQKCDFAFEVLIHDDASTDNTAKIIREYAAKYPEIIKPIFQKENQFSKGIRGITATFNLPRAKGKYIALCEGDDYWTDPLKLQKQVDFLEQNEQYVAVGHQREVLTSGGVFTNQFSKDVLFTQCILFKNIINQDYYCYSINIFNGDTFLHYFLKCKGMIVNLDFVGAVYRYDGQGIYSGISDSIKLENQLDSFKKIYLMLLELGTEKLQNEIRIKIVQNYLSQFYTNINSKLFSQYLNDIYHLKLFKIKTTYISLLKIIKYSL